MINLFEDTEGTDGDDYRATSSDVTVATVEITSNPKVRVTPVGPGTATIRVVFLKTGERREFSVRVLEPPPAPGPPAIPPLPDRTYEQGETIEAFSIAVTDPNGDAVTVTVTGLPDGLTWSPESGRVSGTVAAGAAARAYTVTVTANDGTSDAVTAAFTITVTPPAPRKWPVDHTIRHAGGSSRLLIERPGADGWARGSCTFGGSIFAYHRAENRWPGLRCDVVVHEFPPSLPDISREYRFQYTASTGHANINANQPICPGLHNRNFDASGTVNYGSALSVGDPYDVERWFCQMRDYNSGTPTFVRNKIRNVSFDTSARRLSFEIDLGGALIGRELFIGLWLWNHPAPGYLSAETPGEGPHHYKSFPD